MKKRILYSLLFALGTIICRRYVCFYRGCFWGWGFPFFVITADSAKSPLSITLPVYLDPAGDIQALGGGLAFDFLQFFANFVFYFVVIKFFVSKYMKS